MEGCKVCDAAAALSKTKAPPPELPPTRAKRARTPPPAEPDIKLTAPAPMPMRNKSMPLVGAPQGAKAHTKKPPPPAPPPSMPTRPTPIPREIRAPPGLEGFRVPMKAPPPKEMPFKAKPMAKAHEAMLPSPKTAPEVFMPHAP